jgi:F-type H+-transporting ATPase subunit a
MDSVSVNGAYVYFTIPIFGGIDITQTTISLLVVSLILGFAGWYFGKDIKKRPGKMQVLIEKGVSMLQNLVCETMGAHNIGWVPYIGTVFLSSLLGSLIGMTGFLRSTTADLSVPLTWGIMTSVIIWYHSIKNNGFLNWLKGFTEPIVVMTPMNIISEIAQPISMAFRHFGNVAGGGVITSILYTALGMLSTMIVGVLSKTIIIPLIVVAAAAALFVYGRRNQKKAAWITAIVFGVLGLFGVLQYTGILTDVPILQFGIPAVLSVYFDVFSGFIQAFVFSLLSMVYISGACPPPAEKTDNSIKS